MGQEVRRRERYPIVPQMLLHAAVPAGGLLGLERRVAVRTVQLIERGGLVALAPACAQHGRRGQGPSRGRLSGIMLTETLVVIMPFTRGQGQAGNHLALQLHIFPYLAGLSVRGGGRGDLWIRPALFLLHAEYGLIALDDSPGPLILHPSVVAPVAIAFGNGVDSAVEVRVLRRRVFISNTILQVIIEEIEVEAGVVK